MKQADNIEVKRTYNYYLKRYQDGCNYIEEHPEQAEKYEKQILIFLNVLNAIIAALGNMTDDEIREGFKIE